MANYPTSLDSFTNPSSVDSLSAPSHSQQHSDANDAIEALEAKVGIGTSTAGSATAGHVLVASAGGTTSWTTVSAGAISTTGGTAGQYLSAGTAGVAQWATVTIPESGLTLINTQTLSGSSGVSFTDVFSSTYTHYKLLLNITASTDLFLRIRARMGSSDYTGTNGGGASWYAGTASNTGFMYSQANSNGFGTINRENGPGFHSLDLYPVTTSLIFTGTGWGSYAFAASLVSSYIGATTSNVTGFTIYPSTGTISGTIALYGYRKSL